MKVLTLTLIETLTLLTLPCQSGMLILILSLILSLSLTAEIPTLG